MSTPRSEFALVTLHDSRLLAIGGYGGSIDGLASCELYDPRTGSWTPTGSLATGRFRFTATVLTDGTVLVAGGTTGYAGGQIPSLASAELYDPVSGTWSTVGSLGTPRQYHVAAMLPDGRVLVAGGADGRGTVLGSAEVYDPATRSFSPAPPLPQPRWGATATGLPDGRVLVIGGAVTGVYGMATSTELYDPVHATWSDGAPMSVGRQDPPATLVTVPARAGRPAAVEVVVAGGIGSDLGPVAATEVYDVATGAWRRVQDMHAPRDCHTLTAVADGELLAAGSCGGTGATASAELFDPLTDTWRVAVSMYVPRASMGAAALPDGDVLIAGGNGPDAGPPTATAELFSIG